jgi:hypothetical protein
MGLDKIYIDFELLRLCLSATDIFKFCLKYMQSSLVGNQRKPIPPSAIQGRATEMELQHGLWSGYISG